MDNFTTIEMHFLRASLESKSDGEIAALLERTIEEVHDKINEITDGGAEARSVSIQQHREHCFLKTKAAINEKALAKQKRIEEREQKARMRSEQKEKDKKEAREKSARMQTESHRQHQKKQTESRRTYKTRVVNIQELVSVKIDSKTTVFVSPGTDIEKVKKQYTRPPLSKESFI
jgi:hypothetical protein